MEYKYKQYKIEPPAPHHPIISTGRTSDLIEVAVERGHVLVGEGGEDAGSGVGSVRGPHTAVIGVDGV